MGSKIYRFSNRRRAKDAIMQVAQVYGTRGLTVFVRQELVFVDITNNSIPSPSLDTIMYYADQIKLDISEVMVLDEITELYRESGVDKFRV